jgi:hypothetical protein
MSRYTLRLRWSASVAPPTTQCSGRDEVDRDGGQLALLVEDARGQVEQQLRHLGDELAAGRGADLDLEDGHDGLLGCVR